MEILSLLDGEADSNDAFIEINEDWTTETKLNKEFETLGFYISDHPLNQYKSIFKQYNIVNFDEFENDKDILSSNIACTILKVQEKKTQKGGSYGIVKFSDISNVFEVFIFSDIFELNRDNLVEGNSVMLTLIKNYTDDNKIQKRINVKKVLSLKDVVNKPIKNIVFKFKDFKDLIKLKKLNLKDGETEVKIYIESDDKSVKFQLKEKRKIDYNLLNILNLEKNIEIM